MKIHKTAIWIKKVQIQDFFCNGGGEYSLKDKIGLGGDLDLDPPRPL